MKRIVMPVGLLAAFALYGGVVQNVGYSPVAPKLDGDLRESAWEACPWSSDFGRHHTGGAVANRTRFKALYTDDAFYVAFECMERDMDRLAQEAQTVEFWNCDVVEIFFQPRKDELIHLICSARGNLNEEIPGRTAIRTGNLVGWTARSRLAADRWTTEVCVPLHLLGVSPDAGDVRVPANFCRNETPSKELSSWSRTDGFATVACFGTLVLGKAPPDRAATVKAASARPHPISIVRFWKTVRNDPEWAVTLEGDPATVKTLDRLVAAGEGADTSALSAAFETILRRHAGHEKAEREALHRLLFED